MRACQYLLHKRGMFRPVGPRMKVVKRSRKETPLPKALGNFDIRPPSISRDNLVGGDAFPRLVSFQKKRLPATCSNGRACVALFPKMHDCERNLQNFTPFTLGYGGLQERIFALEYSSSEVELFRWLNDIPENLSERRCYTHL
jgi:hypothetical protein